MTPIVVLRAAQADLRRAARFYEEEAPGLGAEFLNQVELAFARLSERPEIGAPLPTGARKFVVRRFPFLLIYRADPDRVVVLAAAHQRRHPDSWLGRK